MLATLSGIPHAGAATVLGTADSFAVLAGSMVTNVPTSNIVGNVGVWPGSAITGFNSSPGVAVSDPQVTGGLVHAGTVAAQLAQNDLTGAITSLGLMGTGTTLINPDLAGLTLIPGVYSVHSGVSNLTGTLTLDGQGNANAGWVFLMDSDLITSPSSTVNVINTGSGAGVFWDVRSSATLDTATSFQGNILADQSITLNTGATIGCGRTLASVAAVTLHTNTLGIGCGAGSGGEGSNGFSGGLTVSTSGGIPVFLAPAPVPLPPAVWLFGSGLLGVISVARRKTRGTNESAST
ncbi:MAG: DUF3494 domain-containing protein [Gammaproteobacteria bacterium]|nr:DUF3494 domain-containing protein [Gammaproteobacteria bacterium]